MKAVGDLHLSRHGVLGSAPDEGCVVLALVELGDQSERLEHVVAEALRSELLEAPAGVFHHVVEHAHDLRHPGRASQHDAKRTMLAALVLIGTAAEGLGLRTTFGLLLPLLVLGWVTAGWLK